MYCTYIYYIYRDRLIAITKKREREREVRQSETSTTKTFLIII